MPSGLTKKIYDGSDMSLRGFSLSCVRQFTPGYIASKGGNEELSPYRAPVLKASDFYINKLHGIEEELKYWKDIVSNNPAQLNKEYTKYLQYREEENKKYLDEKNALKERYISMIEKVNSWEVPEQYLPLKKLMLEQLDMSCSNDCSEYLPYSGEPESAEKFLKNKLDNLARDLEYYTEKYETEVKNTQENNEYLRGLYEELDKVEPYTSVWEIADKDETYLSVRALNAIMRLTGKPSLRNIFVEEIVNEYTIQDFININGVGKKTINEIIEVFKSLGYTLKEK